MITAILIILAAIFKAVADTLAHHFFSSVFRRWESSPFWNPLHQDNDKVRRIFGYPLDAWHISNSGMIWCFIAAIVFNDLEWKPVWQIVGVGFGFNLIFIICYHKIFRRF